MSIYDYQLFLNLTVAPHAGAWIEIIDWNLSMLNYMGRTSRRCVDWNIKEEIGRWLKISRTSRRCVDWNSSPIKLPLESKGRTSRRCVDWNWGIVFSWIICILSHLTQVRGLKFSINKFSSFSKCRTSRRCVDWNHYIY